MLERYRRQKATAGGGDSTADFTLKHETIVDHIVTYTVRTSRPSFSWPAFGKSLLTIGNILVSVSRSKVRAHRRYTKVQLKLGNDRTLKAGYSRKALYAHYPLSNRGSYIRALEPCSWPEAHTHSALHKIDTHGERLANSRREGRQ